MFQWADSGAQVVNLLGQIEPPVLIYGFVASILLLLMGTESRVLRYENYLIPKPFFKSAMFAGGYTASFWVTAVYTSFSMVREDAGSVSLTLTVWFLVLWVLSIFGVERLFSSIARHWGVFRIAFAISTGFIVASAAISFTLLTVSFEIQSVNWLGIAFLYFVSMLVMGLRAGGSRKLYFGKPAPVAIRAISILALALLSLFESIFVRLFVELNPHPYEMPWYLLPMKWGNYEGFTSLVSVSIIVALVYRVYQMIDKYLRDLQTDRENLQKLNKIALQEVASASDSLRVKQNKIAQLEKVIVSAKNDRLLSVEGVLAALTTLEEGMFEWDIEDDTIEMSAYWVRLFGLSNKTGTRQSVTEWKAGFLREDLFAFDQAMEKMLGGIEQSLSIQIRYQSTGTLLKLEIRMVAVRNPYGLSGKIVGIFHDRTQEMDLELSIRQELSEESILSTRKTQFVSYLAHEIRTPMTIIASAKALMESALNAGISDPERIFPFVDQIGTALGSLRALVDETLMFMGTNYSKNQIHVERLKIAKLIERFVEVEQKRRYLGRLIQVRFPEGLGDVDLYSDGVVISQAMRHLANHVLELPKEEPVIYLEAESRVLWMSLHLARWPDWLVESGELEPQSSEEIIVPFSDEALPFSLLITKRVIRLVNGRLMIKSRAGHHRLVVEIPCLKEDSCLES